MARTSLAILIIVILFCVLALEGISLHSLMSLNRQTRVLSIILALFFTPTCTGCRIVQYNRRLSYLFLEEFELNNRWVNGCVTQPWNYLSVGRERPWKGCIMISCPPPKILCARQNGVTPSSLIFFIWMPALFWCIVLVYFWNCHYSRVSNSGRKTWSCFYFCLSRAGKTWIHGFIFERTASLKCECRCSGWLVIAVWTFQTSSCYLRVGVASWGGRFLLTEWRTWQMWKWQTNKHPGSTFF